MNIPFYCHFNNVGSSVEIVGVKFPSPKNIDRTRLESITSEVRQKTKAASGGYFGFSLLSL